MSTYREIQAALGRVIRQARNERGWSLRDLERASQVRRGALSKIEHGKANPCLRTIERLAAAFDQSPSELMRTVQWDAELPRERAPAKGGAR